MWRCPSLSESGICGEGGTHTVGGVLIACLEGIYAHGRRPEQNRSEQLPCGRRMAPPLWHLS